MEGIVTRAKLRALKTEHTFEKLLVDTGATYTVIPREIAEKVGVHVTPYSVELILADKGRRKAEIGVAEIEVEARRAPVDVAIVDDGFPLLGVQALEVLGFEVNPITKKLEPYREPGPSAPHEAAVRSKLTSHVEELCFEVTARRLLFRLLHHFIGLFSDLK